MPEYDFSDLKERFVSNSQYQKKYLMDLLPSQRFESGFLDKNSEIKQTSLFDKIDSNCIQNRSNFDSWFEDIDEEVKINDLRMGSRYNVVIVTQNRSEEIDGDEQEEFFLKSENSEKEAEDIFNSEDLDEGVKSLTHLVD